MKIALLAAGNSSHTTKWVNSLSERGHDVHLITMEKVNDINNVTIHILPYKKPLGYYTNTKLLKRLLAKLQPDILHAHYSSGYGTLGRLVNYRPCILSVWGADVFVFPYQSKLKYMITAKNLRHYDHICSTSEMMADQVSNLCSELNRPTVIAFGVDTSQFAPMQQINKNSHLTVGIIKSLEQKYAIDILIKAFANVCKVYDNIVPIRLMIIGNGSLEKKLKYMAVNLGINDRVDFISQIPHTDVPLYMNNCDIFVNASRDNSESFGVAVLEASACKVPVITSNIGGLPEVSIDGVTGKIVKVDDIQMLADTILELAKDKSLRQRLGENGRNFVKEHYEWSECVDKMEKVYETVVEKNRYSK